MTMDSPGGGQGEPAGAPSPSDVWDAQVRREAAKAIGQWLEARGRLNQPIQALTIGELEAMAESAIAKWVTLNSSRRIRDPQGTPHLNWLFQA